MADTFLQRLVLCAILSVCQSELFRDNNQSQGFRIVQNEWQSTIIEQLVNTYTFGNASDEHCRLHSVAYRNALINFEPWALQMLDSSSKLQAGFMVGDWVNFGSFSECIRVRSEGTFGVINGKFCTLSVATPPSFLREILTYKGINDNLFEHVKPVYDNTFLEWAICIPDTCGRPEILDHFKDKVDGLFEGLNFTLRDTVQCTTLADTEESFTRGEIATLGLIGCLVSLVLVSTIMEMYKRWFDVERGNETMFSIIANTNYLLRETKSHQKMACLNGIRTLSIVFVIFGHRYLMTVFFPTVNSFEFIDWLSKLPSHIIVGGTVSVDSFLLLSGLLLSYNFLIYMIDKKQKFNYFKYIIHRYLRLTPSFAFTILVITCFGHRMGTGPRWETSWKSVVEPCQNYWWSALLYVQSYVNPDEMCILQCWYLNIDTFYYVFAPLLLLPLAKYEAFGMINVFVVWFASMAMNFFLAWKHQYVVHSLLDDELPTSDYFAYHYTQPHTRASPYILGIVFGYILFKCRNKKVRMSPWTVFFGWTFAISIMVATILSNRIFLDTEYVYDRLASSAFIAVHRSGWVVALSWIIFACINGYGGPVNTFLSSNLFSVGAKLTYSAYLIHMQFQFFDNGANKMPNFFSNLTLIRKGFGDVAIAFLIGYFLTILVECPVYRLSVKLFRANKGVEPTDNQDKSSQSK